MITVVHSSAGLTYSGNADQLEGMSVDTIGDSTATSGSYFSNNMDFNREEREILASMMQNKKAKKRSSKTRRSSAERAAGSANKGLCILQVSDHGGSTRLGESVATALTELDSPYMMSDTQSVASQSVTSVQLHDTIARTLTSIQPLRRRLSREEQESFANGSSTGDFTDDDSFGSIEDADFAAFSAAPPAKQLSRPVAYDRASSRTSLQSVGEDLELRSDKLALSPPQSRNALGSMLSKQAKEYPEAYSGDEASAEMSIDPLTVFEKGKKKRVYRKKDAIKSFPSQDSSITMDTMLKVPPAPADADADPSFVAEKKKKKKKKDKKKKEKDKDKQKTSSSALQSPNTVFMESADQILERWNKKIGELEQEVDNLEPDNKSTEKAPRLRDTSSDDMNLSAGMMSGLSLHGASSSKRMTRHLSMSNLSAAANSSRMSDVPSPQTPQRRANSAQRRRPSLTSVFEWNREPSVPNLAPDAIDPDPPMEDESHLIMNVSTVPDRRINMRRSLSTTDVSHYNKTTSWPTRRGSSSSSSAASRGMHSLHAQFYRRSTNLPAPARSSARSTESSPVVTPEQILKVMEPVTMREVLEFKGLADSHHRRRRDDDDENNKNNNKRRQKKLVNYGDILDNQSASSGRG